MKNLDQQIISRKRVAVYGEVMTSRHEVEAMLDLVGPETERVESRFLESYQRIAGQHPLPDQIAARCILAKNILNGDAIHTRNLRDEKKS